MKRLKVMTVVGTRPEIIRLSRVIPKLDEYFDHVLVHTGQNYDYELNEIFFEELELRRPDHYLDAAGATPAETIGKTIIAIDPVLEKEKPDAMLVLGDTNSCLCVIPAKRRKIPIFHMEAGNRCFDQNVPEEINRKIVDHVSDINLPYTEHSRRYLLSEGFRKDHIFVTGSPMREVLEFYQKKIEISNALEKLNLKIGGYILVSAHREENLDLEKNFYSVVETLNKVAEEFQLPIIYSTHPRSLKRIKRTGVKFNPLISNLKPFGFLDYNKLQQEAFCVLSDSGTLSEEATILGFPGVLFRTSTERPEVIDQGSIVIGGIEPDGVINSIRLARDCFESKEKAQLPLNYLEKNVSSKVVKIIESYYKIVNLYTWRK